MHLYFSGVGGTGIGPLCLLAKAAGYEVSGSDAKASQYFEYLKAHGVSDIHVGQERAKIAKVHADKPIDWFVYSSALPASHEELVFCQEKNIRTSKRDEFINELIKAKNLRLIAIAGTQGKTTTTAMVVWLFKQLGVPVCYALGTKVSFGEMAEFDPTSLYFVYEADEYDHNFLAFHPYLSLISGLDWDHPDIYPTREVYDLAFKQFVAQSHVTWLWPADAKQLGLKARESIKILGAKASALEKDLSLPGQVNRQNAWLAANAVQPVLDKPLDELVKVLNSFPGSSRRFEQIVPGLYSDYAHTPPKIKGALQMAKEVASGDVVVVYEGIHNLRQHFIKDELASLFDDVKQVYIVPTYLGREDDKLKVLNTDDLVALLSQRSKEYAQAAQLNKELHGDIQKHLADGDLVICFSASGAGGLDEWLRREFAG